MGSNPTLAAFFDENRKEGSQGLLPCLPLECEFTCHEFQHEAT